MTGHLRCALEARRRGVHGCIIEPAFGINLDTFRFGWRKVPDDLTRLFQNWAADTYDNLHVFEVAVCVDDPWPPGTLDALDRYRLVKLKDAQLRQVLTAAERILETTLAQSRPHLMAFLAAHDDLRHVGRTKELAAAWAHQLARDQLFRAELAVHDHCSVRLFWDEVLDPKAFCRCDGISEIPF